VQLAVSEQDSRIDTAHLAIAGSTLEYGRKQHFKRMLPVR
jgi:hypothetical protein